MVLFPKLPENSPIEYTFGSSDHSESPQITNVYAGFSGFAGTTKSPWSENVRTGHIHFFWTSGHLGRLSPKAVVSSHHNSALAWGVSFRNL